MALDIGRIAHKAYRDYSGTNCICFDREWEDLPKEDQDAWRSVGQAVCDYLHQCEEDMDNEVIG